MVYQHQKLWCRWVPLAEWWYNTNFHSSIKTTPFQALYGYPPPQIPLGNPPKSSVEAEERHEVLLELKQQLLKSRDIMKKFADAKRTEKVFAVGDWVYLKLQSYRQTSVNKMQCKKLSLKYYGPFEVIKKVGTVAYRLKLPEGSLIHPVFHVSQLKAKIGAGMAVSPDIPLINPAGKGRELPEKILDRAIYKKGNAAGVKLLIKWKNSPDEDATWEDYEALSKDFPQFILEDKDSFKAGGVSGTTMAEAASSGAGA